jgi:hypothetical protein
MLIESFGYSALKGYNKTVGLVHRIERLGKIKLEISMGKARKDGEDDVNVCHLDFMELQIELHDIYDANFNDDVAIALEVKDNCNLFDKCFRKLMNVMTPDRLQTIVKEAKECGFLEGVRHNQRQLQQTMGIF